MNWEVVVPGRRLWEAIKPVEKFLRRAEIAGRAATASLCPADLGGGDLYFQVVCFRSGLGNVKVSVPIQREHLTVREAQTKGPVAGGFHPVLVDAVLLAQTLRQASGQEITIFGWGQDAQSPLRISWMGGCVDLPRSADPMPDPVAPASVSETGSLSFLSGDEGGGTTQSFADALRGALVAARAAALSGLDSVAIERRPRQKSGCAVWVHATDTYRLHLTDLTPNGDGSHAWREKVLLPIPVAEALEAPLRCASSASLRGLGKALLAEIVLEMDGGIGSGADGEAVDEGHDEADLPAAARPALIELLLPLLEMSRRPDVAAILDTGEPVGEARADAEDLLGAVAIAKIGSDPDGQAHPVRISAGPDGLVVTAGGERADAEGTADCAYEGAPMGIRMDARFLVDGAAQAGGGRISLSYFGVDKPLLVESVGAPDRSLALIMPIRTHRKCNTTSPDNNRPDEGATS